MEKISETLASYVAQLGGKTVLLPPVLDVPGKVIIFARRPGLQPEKVVVEALHFEASRVLRPLNMPWPQGPFRCDRAEYKNGDVCFFLGDEVFGFGVNQESDVTMASAEVDRAELDDGGIAGALSRFAAKNGLTPLALDPRQAASSHAEASNELAVELPVEQRRSQSLTWLRPLMLILGLALGGLGVFEAGRGVVDKQILTAVGGLALILIAAVVIGFSFTRLLPPAD